MTKITFPSIKNLLRRIVVENQVRMQEDVINTHNKGTNGRNAKIIRKTLKRESRMLRKKFSDNKGLSYDRIKDVIYGTMYQAFKVTNQLVNKGIINKRTRIKEVRCDAKVCTNNMAITDFEGSVIVISAKTEVHFPLNRISIVCRWMMLYQYLVMVREERRQKCSLCKIKNNKIRDESFN